MKKILVLGYFGYQTNQLDGQTIKTRNVYQLLKNYSVDDDVRFADTQQFRHGLKHIWKFFKDLIRCNTLVILPCLNNLKYVFPGVYIISKVARFKIVHIGIGGWHDKYLQHWPIVRKMLGKIKINLLETSITAKKLKSRFGYENIEVFPNFRLENIEKFQDKPNSNRLKLVFMARVSKKKGLDTLSQLCKRISVGNHSSDFSLTIYGPVESVQDEEFLYSEIIDRYNFAEYLGTLDPAEINSTLLNYDVFIFPTHYFTEGLPGSILDAYNAGLPVIATKWEHAEQFINHFETGFIVDFNNPIEDIYNNICFLLLNPNELSRMRKNAFAEHSKYSADSAWKLLKKHL